MPTIPLGIGAYQRDGGLVPPVELYNMLLEKDDSGSTVDKFFRIQRPGLAPYVTTANPVIGLFRQDGILSGNAYAAAANMFYKINQDVAQPIGALLGTGLAVFAPSIDRIGVVRTPKAYLYEGGAGLDPLALPDDRAAVDIEGLNGYLIFLTPNGRFYWLEPGSDIIDPLDFANAESSSDGGVAVHRLVDELYFFNRETVEVFQATGDQDAPFQRAAGRVYDKGCLHRDTVHLHDNGLVWVSNDLRIFRTGQVPQDIGSPFLSERLRKRTADPSACVIKFDDHELYVLRIPGQGSFAYDASTRQWSEFGSVDEDQWNIQVSASLPNSTLVGDATSGKVYFLDADRSNDDDEVLERRVTGNVALPSRPIRTDSVSLSMGAEADCNVRIRWREAREDYPSQAEELLVRAPQDVVNLYRLGAMREPYRAFEVSVVDDVKVRISGMTFGEAFQ